MNDDESAEILARARELYRAKVTANAAVYAAKENLKAAKEAADDAADALDGYLRGIDLPLPLLDGEQPSSLTIEARPYGGVPSSVTFQDADFDKIAEAGKALRRRG
jgi:hypothetical protein